ncbi:MAG: LysR family transcriptional regulator [Neomegalonema sp.]|nr:LysR family transcriptional regulator [Neomegalonema sp.]
MRLEELILFERAAALGNLSAAARELGLSPAAASARLQNLESAVGATLFARTTRSLTLTEDGEIFLTHASAALGEIEEGKARLGGQEQTPRGTLRLSLPGPFGQKHVLPFLREFLDRYPQIELDLHVSDELVNVVEGRYDLVVRIGPVADSALMLTKLAENRRVIVAAPSYLERRGSPQMPEDLYAHDCIWHSDMRIWRFRRGSEEKVIRLKSGPVHGYDGGVIRDAAVYGLGITFKSLYDVGEELASGRLVTLLDDWEFQGAGAIWALRPPGRFVPPRVRVFIAFLKEKYGPRPYWETAIGEGAAE